MSECPLQFPDFRPVDHSKVPRYASVLLRPQEDGIAVEELDTLQQDLETLLAAASRRLRQLESETQVLIDWQDKKTTPTKESPPIAASKKGGKGDSKVPKKLAMGKMGGKPSGKMSGKPIGKLSGKLGPSPVLAISSHSGPGRPKTKNTPQPPKLQQQQQQQQQEFEFSEEPLPEVPRMPKNDAPNRFWASVEQYCAEISHQDLKNLEELTKVSGGGDNDNDYYKIPPLGKHYAVRWAQEDMIEEQKEGARAVDKKASPGSKVSPNLLKRSETAVSAASDDHCPFGPLTQRLLSALVEENIVANMDDGTSLTDYKGTEESKAIIPPSKSFSVPHTKTLESRIREELLYQGLLESEDLVSEGSEDEILTELKKRQSELKALSAHNRTQKQGLLKLAREEINKQELRNKARIADTEVVEAYRRIQAAKQKKRTPTKKERDMAWKSLKDREAIIKLLDS